MATALTQAQKDRKNDLARARRAAQASEGSVAVMVEPTEATDEALVAVFKTRKGNPVEAPVSGFMLKVVQKYRDGSRLLTGDGRQIKRDTECPHVKDFPDGYTGVAFEVVGGPIAGTRGFVHRARGCNRPYTLTA